MFDLDLLWGSRCELPLAVHIAFLPYLLLMPDATWFINTATCFHPVLLVRPNQIHKWGVRGKRLLVFP